MANNINVKLKQIDGINVLDIDDNGGGNGNNGGNKVGVGQGAQTISWNLTGNLAQGEFQAMTSTPPGFKWIQTPPAGVFSPPQVCNGGRELQIQDTNTGTATSGRWIYQIAVSLGGVVYVSQASTLPTSSVKDPVIINKEP